MDHVLFAQLGLAVQGRLSLFGSLSRVGGRWSWRVGHLGGRVVDLDLVRDGDGGPDRSIGDLHHTVPIFGLNDVLATDNALPDATQDIFMRADIAELDPSPGDLIGGDEFTAKTIEVRRRIWSALGGRGDGHLGIARGGTSDGPTHRELLGEDELRLRIIGRGGAGKKRNWEGKGDFAPSRDLDVDRLPLQVVRVDDHHRSWKGGR
jgi:hypothetical protein